MARKVSIKTKKEQKRGLGRGSDYVPWIKANEISSTGVASVVSDWKNGRAVHLLSKAEKKAYYIYRWNDDIVEIREQFPLKRDITKEIAESNGLRNPGNSDFIMTTDFLLTYKDGH